MKPTIFRPNGDTEPKQEPALKPTVIPAEPAPPAPSPAAASPPSVRRPTVIPTGTPVTAPVVPASEPPPPEPVALKPSVVIMPPQASPTTLPAVQATAMPGKRPRRIPVTVTQVFMRNPGLKLEIQQRIVELVASLNLDDIPDRTAILWGHEVQKAYAAQVEQALNLCQTETLMTVTKYVNRMTEILGSIDLRKVCGLDKGGFFGQLMRLNTAAIDTPAELEAARAELKQLVELMHSRVDQLLTLKEDIERVAATTEELGVEMEVLAEAGAFIADHLNAHESTKSTLAQRFMERSISLTQTLAQIRSSGQARELQVEQPLKLIAAVQHATLVAMPGWLSSITGILSMLGGTRKPNVTEVDELGDTTKKIIAGLTSR